MDIYTIVHIFTVLLFQVVLGTVISYFVKLEEVYEVKIVGDVPIG